MEFNLPHDALEFHTPHCRNFLANDPCEFRRTLLSFEEIESSRWKLGKPIRRHVNLPEQNLQFLLSHKRLVPAREHVKVTLSLIFRDERDPDRISPH